MQAEYFFKFQEWLKKEKKSYTIGLRSFQAMKPYFVRTMKDRDVCCCKQHVEMQLLCKAFAKERQTNHPMGCVCQCDAICRPQQNSEPLESESPGIERPCIAHKYSLMSLIEWCAQALCPKGPEDAWHKRDCLVAICDDCGPGLIPLCPWEERLDEEAKSVHWQTYEYVFLDELPQAIGKKRKAWPDEQNAK